MYELTVMAEDEIKCVPIKNMKCERISPYLRTNKLQQDEYDLNHVSSFQ